MVGRLAGNARMFGDEKNLPVVSQLVILGRSRKRSISEAYPVPNIAEIVNGLILQLILLFGTALKLSLWYYESLVSRGGL